MRETTLIDLVQIATQLPAGHHVWVQCYPDVFVGVFTQYNGNRFAERRHRWTDLDVAPGLAMLHGRLHEHGGDGKHGSYAWRSIP